MNQLLRKLPPSQQKQPKFVRVLYLKQAKKPAKQLSQQTRVPRRDADVLNDRRSIAYLSSLIQDEVNNSSSNALLPPKRRSLYQPTANTYNKVSIRDNFAEVSPVKRLDQQGEPATFQNAQQQQQQSGWGSPGQFITKPKNTSAKTREAKVYTKLPVPAPKKAFKDSASKELSLVRLVGDPVTSKINPSDEKRQSATILYNIKKYGSSYGWAVEEHERRNPKKIRNNKSLQEEFKGSKYPTDYTGRFSLLEDEFNEFCKTKLVDEKAPEETQSKKNLVLMVPPRREKSRQEKRRHLLEKTLSVGQNESAQFANLKSLNNSIYPETMKKGSQYRTSVAMSNDFNQEHRKNVIYKKNFKEIVNFDWIKVDKNSFAIDF